MFKTKTSVHNCAHYLIDFDAITNILQDRPVDWRRGRKSKQSHDCHNFPRFLFGAKLRFFRETTYSLRIDLFSTEFAVLHFIFHMVHLLEQRGSEAPGWRFEPQRGAIFAYMSHRKVHQSSAYFHDSPLIKSNEPTSNGFESWHEFC